MLTTKNRVRISPAAVLIVSLAWWLSGCTPAGPKALLQGEKYLEQGQVDRAARSLERAVRLIPNNAQAWNHLGLAYHRLGRLPDATAAYQKALALDSALVSTRFNLGCVNLERGDNEAAMRELTAYLVAVPDSSEAMIKLGTAQLRARQTDPAEQSFRQVLKANPGSAEALNGLGLVHVQRRRYPEAYQQFQAAIRSQPGYAAALRNAAVVAHQHLKNKPVALRNYQELLTVTNVPDREAIEQLTARLQQELQAQSTAKTQQVQTARSPVAADSGSPQAKPAAQANRPAPPPAVAVTDTPVSTPSPTPATNNAPPPTVATDNSARPVQPRPAALEKAPVPVSEVTPTPTATEQTSARVETNRQPERPAPVSEPPAEGVSPFPRYRYRATVNVKPGDRATAERYLSEGYQAHTRYRFSEAIGAYERAIQSDPSLFDAHYNLGVAAFENGDLPLALSSYETALMIEPDSLKARYNFASTLEEAGYPKDAADELDKLAVAHPNEVRVHSTLANLYARKLGDPRRARVHYQRVLELDPRHPDATAIRYWLEDNR
jgi:tetratricopeptide (TPR) repeat protein